MSQNLSTAAVVIGALRVKTCRPMQNLITEKHDRHDVLLMLAYIFILYHVDLK